MIMTWIPTSSAFPMVPSHTKASLASAANSGVSLFSDNTTQEQILTAPELRSMGQSDLVSQPGSFANGVLLQSSEEYGYIQRETHYHVNAIPQTQCNPYHYRHSYHSTTQNQSIDPSRYLIMMNQYANQVIDSSVNSAIAMTASSRGVPPAIRRRTQSLDVQPSVPSMAMHASLPYGGLYGETVSAPGSPSPAESSPMQPNRQPEFLPPNMAVDGQPHPFFVPMPTPPAEADRAHSPSPSISATFQPMFSSSASNTSACTSPVLSSPSPALDRKRFSTDSAASQDSLHTATATCHSHGSKKSAAKQRYICHIPDCNRTFSRPYNLKSHGLTHDAHRPHACGKCSKTFARIHDRDRHMNSHMPQKPHVCIVCLGRFARQDAVIRHLKLSNETNACSWILKSKGVSFRDAAAGRATRESLGDEAEIRQTLEALEEHARKTRAIRTLEMMGASVPALQMN
ncbi:hypothetical protein BGZ54_003572 [Gamsiella multidivaricata]|nr:hypothetical protein BGZ54_003572 [Gamsiella multidivaricata]